MTNYTIAIILIVLGNIGGIYLIVIQLKDAEKDKIELKKELTEIKSERDLLKDDLEKRDKKITDQTDNIIDLSKKLQEKSEYIQNYLLGGDGFIFANIVSLPIDKSGNQKFTLQLENRFDAPLYNVSIEVFDYLTLQNSSYHKGDFHVKYLKRSDFKKARIFNTHLPEVSPGQIIIVNNFFRDTNTHFFIIRMFARNRTVLQKIAMIKVGKDYCWGTMTFSKEGEKIFEFFGENYTDDIKKALSISLPALPEALDYKLDND